MTMTTAEKTARLNLIKKIAERRKTLSKVKTKTRAIKAPKVDRSFMDVPKETNIYAWTDAPKYAEEYYGEVYRETTRFDNDWN